MRVRGARWMLALALVSLICSFAARAADAWSSDYPAALAQAKKEGRLVLLDFTGSDWCQMCLIMKKRVFDSEVFQKYAAENLVLVEVDFPISKPQSKALQKQNRALAAKFDLADHVTGDIKTVPVLILVTPDGQAVATKKLAFFFPSEFIGWAKKAALKTAHPQG